MPQCQPEMTIVLQLHSQGLLTDPYAQPYTVFVSLIISGLLTHAAIVLPAISTLNSLLHSRKHLVTNILQKLSGTVLENPQMAQRPFSPLVALPASFSFILIYSQ